MMNKIDLSKSTAQGTDIVCTWQDTGMFPLYICYSQMPLCHITTSPFFVSTTEKLGQPYQCDSLPPTYSICDEIIPV